MISEKICKRRLAAKAAKEAKDNECPPPPDTGNDSCLYENIRIGVTVLMALLMVFFCLRHSERYDPPGPENYPPSWGWRPVLTNAEYVPANDDRYPKPQYDFRPGLSEPAEISPERFAPSYDFRPAL